MKIKVKGQEYDVQQFADIVTARRPKEVLIVSAGIIPSNFNPHNYFIPFERAKHFLLSKGANVGELNDCELREFHNSTGDQFRYLTAGIRANVDFGLLVHAYPIKDDPTIKKMARIFPENNLYLAFPLGSFDETLIRDCLFEEYKKEPKLEQMIVSLENLPPIPNQ